MNLVTNAVKFSEGNKAGSIHIEGTVHIQRTKSQQQLIGFDKNLNRDQTFLKISVRDEGIGILKVAEKQEFLAWSDQRLKNVVDGVVFLEHQLLFINLNCPLKVNAVVEEFH